MIIFFIVTLGLSIAGLVSLLVLKRLELATGHIFFSGVRPRMGELFYRTLLWIERDAPALAQELVRSLYKNGRHMANPGAAPGILWLARASEQTLRTLRRTTAVAPRAGGEASAFLREVAEHKKKLQDEANRAIYEE